MKPKFIAFHGKQKIKDKYIMRMEAHMAADELVQGTGFEHGKGCAVGCTLNSYNHMGYEVELGIPFTIAILEDNIFETLSKKESISFPLAFLEAIPVGVDLSLVYNKMEIWSLTDEKFGLFYKMKTDEEKNIITDLVELHSKVISGIETTESEWSRVADRADRADRAYLADLADRAYLADLADRADRADRADLADRADRAYLADRADRAKLALAMRDKLLELLKQEALIPPPVHHH